MEDKNFIFSVVIPIYNVENYLKETIESVLKQTIGFESNIQLILVNDGSIDKSEKICLEYKEKYLKNIIYIKQENSGTSAARNKGIDVAKGKYIVFLDADDFISKNALSSLLKFFDRHFDEIDIVAYNLYRYMQNKKKKKVFDRAKIFNRGTDVYNLDGEDFYVVQPSMNVCIKNYYEYNIKFDTSLKYHEDTKYNTMIMMKKKKIGYVDDAIYYYRKYEGQVTDIKSNAYFNFEDMMTLFNYCINSYTKTNGKIEKNIQSLIIHIIRCRLWKKIQNLLPIYEDEIAAKKAKNRLIEVLKKVDNEIIVNDLNLDRYHKMYLLILKDTKFEICTNKKNFFTINSKGIILDEVKDIDVVYRRFKVKNGKIKIMGYLRSPILWFKRPKLYLKYTNKDNKILENEIKLKNTNTELFKTNTRVAKFYGFECEIELNSIKEFEFEVTVDSINLQIKTCIDS